MSPNTAVVPPAPLGAADKTSANAKGGGFMFDAQAWTSIASSVIKTNTDTEEAHQSISRRRRSRSRPREPPQLQNNSQRSRSQSRAIAEGGSCYNQSQKQRSRSQNPKERSRSSCRVSTAAAAATHRSATRSRSRLAVGKTDANGNSTDEDAVGGGGGRGGMMGQRSKSMGRQRSKSMGRARVQVHSMPSRQQKQSHSNPLLWQEKTSRSPGATTKFHSFNDDAFICKLYDEGTLAKAAELLGSSSDEYEGGDGHGTLCREGGVGGGMTRSRSSDALTSMTMMGASLQNPVNNGNGSHSNQSLRASMNSASNNNNLNCNSVIPASPTRGLCPLHPEVKLRKNRCALCAAESMRLERRMKMALGGQQGGSLKRVGVEGGLGADNSNGAGVEGGFTVGARGVGATATKRSIDGAIGDASGRDVGTPKRMLIEEFETEFGPSIRRMRRRFEREYEEEEEEEEANLLDPRWASALHDISRRLALARGDDVEETEGVECVAGEYDEDDPENDYEPQSKSRLDEQFMNSIGNFYGTPPKIKKKLNDGFMNSNGNFYDCEEETVNSLNEPPLGTSEQHLQPSAKAPNSHLSELQQTILRATQSIERYTSHSPVKHLPLVTSSEEEEDGGSVTSMGRTKPVKTFAESKTGLPQSREPDHYLQHDIHPSHQTEPPLEVAILAGDMSTKSGDSSVTLSSVSSKDSLDSSNSLFQYNKPTDTTKISPTSVADLEPNLAPPAMPPSIEEEELENEIPFGPPYSNAVEESAKVESNDEQPIQKQTHQLKSSMRSSFKEKSPSKKKVQLEDVNSDDSSSSDGEDDGATVKTAKSKFQPSFMAALVGISRDRSRRSLNAKTMQQSAASAAAVQPKVEKTVVDDVVKVEPAVTKDGEQKPVASETVEEEPEPSLEPLTTVKEPPKSKPVPVTFPKVVLPKFIPPPIPPGVRGPITHPNYKLGDYARDEDMIIFPSTSSSESRRKGRRSRRRRKSGSSSSSSSSSSSDSSNSDSDSEDEKVQTKKSPAKNIIYEAVRQLSHLDAAFVKRSDGRWTYSIVADGNENEIRFVVNDRGSTKSFPKALWETNVRRIRVLTQRKGDRFVAKDGASRKKRSIGRGRSRSSRGKGRFVSPSPKRRSKGVVNIPPTIFEDKRYTRF
eukprot:g13472.t1 g13472   contig8:756002-759586(-)